MTKPAKRRIAIALLVVAAGFTIIAEVVGVQHMRAVHANASAWVWWAGAHAFVFGVAGTCPVWWQR